MAIKEWTTNFPASIDTPTEQPDLVNSEDTMRVSQIHALRDIGQAIQPIVGDSSKPIGSLLYQTRHYNVIDDITAGIGGEFVEYREGGQTGAITYPQANRARLQHVETGANQRFGFAFTFPTRNIGFELTAFLDLNSSTIRAELAVTNTDSPTAYVRQTLSRSGGVNNLIANDVDNANISTLNIGQNSAWFRLLFDGRVSSFWYSLNSYTSEPNDASYIRVVDKAWARNFWPNRAAVLVDPNGSTGGYVDIRYIRFKVF